LPRAVSVSAKPPRHSRRGPEREVRRMRIFARLQEGWSYEEIGRQEGVTRERIRQIVKQALDKRQVDATHDHALLQIARLAPALRLAAGAVGEGEISAIAPLLKVLERLDKYQGAGAAVETSDYEEGGREKLLHRLNFMAQRMLEEREAKERAAAQAAAEGDDAGDNGEDSAALDLAPDSASDANPPPGWGWGGGAAS
jgi:hypothetical protein